MSKPEYIQLQTFPYHAEVIRDHADLARILWAEPNESSMSRQVYKSTDCGASLHFLDGDRGVVLGSIVEGAEEETEYHELVYPFTDNDFWKTLATVDAEAQEIWMDTHGCPRCEADGYFDDETEYCRVNPNCPECRGKGIVI